MQFQKVQMTAQCTGCKKTVQIIYLEDDGETALCSNCYEECLLQADLNFEMWRERELIG